MTRTLPAAARPSPALGRIIEGLGHEPSRTGSIVVTVFGDAIVPRGGSVWLGTLLAFFRGIGIEDGAVRTAVSRLAADGWLERRRSGRNSFYRLAARGHATFEAATRQIYVPRAPRWNERLVCVLCGDRAIGSALAAAGFGQPSPGIWIAPASVSVPVEAAACLRLDATVEPQQRRRLAAETWPIERMAAAYGRFLEQFVPLREEIEAGLRLSPAEAFAIRVLAIHFYRRIILRDPGLPSALLPEPWAGEAARTTCAELYGLVLETSEAWLDEHGVSEGGKLPVAGPELRHRFSMPPDL